MMSLGEGGKSPISRGKPSWHVRYARRWYQYMVVCLLLVVGQIGLGMYLGFSHLIVTIYSVCMLIYVFGFQLWIVIWLRAQGAGWSTLSIFNRIDGVPCPNCLYPVCKLHDADCEHVCSECGCAVHGVEAIKAWSLLKGYRVPQAWDRWLKDD